MQSLNDKELNRLLMKWEAPTAPDIIAPMLRSRLSGWQWFWKGSFRIPVPVALALAVVLAWLVFVALYRPAVPGRQQISKLSDFRPVREVHIRVIRGAL